MGPLLPGEKVFRTIRGTGGFRIKIEESLLSPGLIVGVTFAPRGDVDVPNPIHLRLVLGADRRRGLTYKTDSVAEEDNVPDDLRFE